MFNLRCLGTLEIHSNFMEIPERKQKVTILYNGYFKYHIIRNINLKFRWSVWKAEQGLDFPWPWTWD